jgi:hypothetical protein
LDVRLTIFSTFNEVITRLAILLLLTGLANLSAQPLNFKINWGHAFDGPKRSTLDDIIGHDASGTYVIRVHYGTADRDSYTLERYDRRFMLVQSQELEIMEGVERARIQHVLFLRSKLYMFYVLPNRATNKNELFVRQVNKSTLYPENTKLKLGEVDQGRYAKGVAFKFRTSRDSSKVVVSYEFQAGWNERKTYGFFVLDENLQLMWRPIAALPPGRELFFVENLKVDNAGNVYLLGVTFNDKRRSKRDGKPDYNYEVLAWSGNGEVMRSYTIALEDRFLTDMQIEVIDSKNLVCAGFYSATGTFSIKGTYFLTVDLETKNIKTASFKDFEIDFIMENLSDRDAHKVRKSEGDEEPALYEYDLDKLLVGKDGSAILIGEQYFVEVDNRDAHHRYYYYNDIIAVKIDPRGQILWAEKVSKNQRTLNDGGYSSSYALAIVKGNICFFFNDRWENLNYNGVGRPLPYYRAKDSIVILATLNQRGEQVRQPVFVTNDVVVTRPRACEQVSNREVILFAQWMKTQRFASMMFE